MKMVNEGDSKVGDAGDVTEIGSNGIGMTKTPTGGQEVAVGPGPGRVPDDLLVVVHRGRHRLMKSGRKESTYDFIVTISSSDFSRISPKDAPQQQAGNSTADKPNVPPAEEESVDLEMPVSPPPLEDVLAARRARRAEILAKYANATASPSPAPAHEVHPISDSIHEVAVDTPGVGTCFVCLSAIHH